ncbi:hypothetical protein [Streptomyces sp. NPDC054866]
MLTQIRAAVEVEIRVGAEQHAIGQRVGHVVEPPRTGSPAR